ncbi:MAG: RluA family pseudouridine synthase [Oscillospiraceae bacterium]
MKSFVITSSDDGIRLNRFLEKVVPALKLTLLYKYLRTKHIKLNRKSCEASTRLCEGDLLELYIPDEFFEQQKKQPDFMRASGNLSILYEDENIALLYKPAGLLAHEDKSSFGDTLVNRFLRHLYERGDYSPDSSTSFTPALCNRIDRGTEGIVLAGKSSQAVSALNKIIKERRIVKKYLCVTVLKPPKDGVYRAYLLKDESENKAEVKSTPFGSAKEIKTGFTLLEERNSLYLVEAELFTGRTHQIRAHLAFLGAPILGDIKYGSKKLNKRYSESRQLLCSYSVQFRLSEDEDELLYYLNDKTFANRNIDFVNKYFKGIRL